MNSEFYNQAGIIAIPIKNQPTSVLMPQPNFIVINSIGGRVQKPFFNPLTQQIEIMWCVQASYKIVFRELLPANAVAQEEVVERVLLLDLVFIPYSYLPIIQSHQHIAANHEIFDILLSAFQFRGALEGFLLQVDMDALQEIITQQTPPPEPDPEEEEEEEEP